MFFLGSLTSCIKCYKDIQTNDTEMKMETTQVASDVEMDDIAEVGSKLPPAANRSNKTSYTTTAVETTVDLSLTTESDEVVETKLKKVRSEIVPKRKHNFRSTIATLKAVKKEHRKAKKGGFRAADVLLVILAIFIPWLSVGIYTGWDVKLTVITALLWILGWLPGVIFGMLVLFDVVG